VQKVLLGTVRVSTQVLRRHAGTMATGAEGTPVALSAPEVGLPADSAQRLEAIRGEILECGEEAEGPVAGRQGPVAGIQGPSSRKKLFVPSESDSRGRWYARGNQTRISLTWAQRGSTRAWQRNPRQRPR